MAAADTDADALAATIPQEARKGAAKLAPGDESTDMTVPRIAQKRQKSKSKSKPSAAGRGVMVALVVVLLAAAAVAGLYLGGIVRI